MKVERNYIWIAAMVVMLVVAVVIPLFKSYSSVFSKEQTESECILRVVNNKIMLGDICIYEFIPVNGGLPMLGIERSMNYIENNDTVKTIEYSIHRSYIYSFLLGETEVTQQLWDCVMPVEVQHLDLAYNKRPVREKSYQEWEEFIQRLEFMTGRTFRVPNIDEWEFAARGGHLSKGYIYSGSNDVEEVAYYKGNTMKSYAKDGIYLVANKKPNELGFFDMSGGVSEFVFSHIKDVNPLTADLWRYAINSNKSGFQPMLTRGGDYNSEANECKMVFPASVSIKAGLRLVLEH